jgi:hypothetical protein
MPRTADAGASTKSSFLQFILRVAFVVLSISVGSIADAALHIV